MCGPCLRGHLKAVVLRNKEWCVHDLDPISLRWMRQGTAATYGAVWMHNVAAKGSLLFRKSSLLGHVTAYTVDGHVETLPICAMGDGIAAVGGMCAHTRQFLCTIEHFVFSGERWEPLPDMGHAPYPPPPVSNERFCP